MTTKFEEAASFVLTCSICFEYYSDQNLPKQLSCQHVCCETCLGQLQSLGLPNAPIACPMRCAENTVVPPGGVADLKTNIYLLTLAEQLENKVGTPSKELFDESVHCMRGGLKQHESSKAELEDEIRELENAESVIPENTSALQERVRRSVQLYVDVVRREEAELLDFVLLEGVNKLQKVREKLARVKKRLAKFIDIANVSSTVDNAASANYLACNTTIIPLLNKLNRATQELIKEPCLFSTIVFDPRRIVKPPNLGRFVSSLQLEPCEEKTLTDFVSAKHIHLARKCKGIPASNGANDALCVCDHFWGTLTIFQKINGNYDEVKRLTNVSHLQDAIINDDASLWVAKWSSIVRYESLAVDRFDVIQSNDKQLTGYNCLTCGEHGDVFAGDYIECSVGRYDRSGVLTRVYRTAIKPNFIHVVRNSHLVLSDWKACKVSVMDLSNGKETLAIDVTSKVQGMCYHEKSDCLLVASSDSGNGVIEQYCFQSGTFVARIAQRLLRPMTITIDSDDTLIIANGRIVQFMTIL